MGYTFGKASRFHLSRVQAPVREISIIALAITDVDFGIHCSTRTLREQAKLVNSGASWTLESKHLTGWAIDFNNYPLNWQAWDEFTAISKAFEEATNIYNRKNEELIMTWGGNWKSKDGPHVEWVYKDKKLRDQQLTEIKKAAGLLK